MGTVQALVGTLKCKHTTKGEQTLSAVNVAYAVSSLLNMSTSVGQVATADAYITIQGTNFLILHCLLTRTALVCTVDARHQIILLLDRM